VSKKSSTSRRTVIVAAIGGAVAMLLWLKLRVVTDVPRSAYADPDKAAQQPAETPR
jgi:hypothetical protein